MKKKVLIFTAKWPLTNNEVDGGSITVLQLVDALKDQYDIDYLYLQKRNDEILVEFPGINHFEIVDGAFLDYQTYNDTNTNKFDIRLKNKDYMNKLIKDRIDSYDKVIIIHCLQAMGLQDCLNENQLKKIVLFPMFLTRSYTLSGDIVPVSYTNEERNILKRISTIITPSNIEKKDIVNLYGVNKDKVFMVPRKIGNISKSPKRYENEVLNICYVGSFKNQKNNLDAIKTIELVSKTYKKVKLHMLGTIQDKTYFQKCLTYIKEHDLENNVVIEKLIPNNEMYLFFKDMDIAISTSKNETFGRAIFESLAAGLPNVIYQDIEPVVDFAKNCKGIRFCKDFKQMSIILNELISNKNELENMSAHVIKFINDFYNNFDLSKKYVSILERKI